MNAKILKSSYYAMIFALIIELLFSVNWHSNGDHEYYFKVMSGAVSSTIIIFEYFFTR